MIANSKTLDTLRRHPIATVLAIYILLAVITSHPLATTPSEVLPSSNNSLWCAWMTSWVAQALPAMPSALFAANIFHPDRAALFYSEPMIGVGFLAWPIWMVTGDVAATYNLTFVLTLVLSALSMFLLMREVLGSLVAATVAGVVFAFTTANYDSAARIQIVSGQWTPLLLFFLIRLWRQGRTRDALGMSVAAVMQGLSCHYYTLYLATLLVFLAPTLLLVRGDRELWGKRWRGVALALVVALPLLVPLYAAQWGASPECANREATQCWRASPNELLERALQQLALWKSTWGRTHKVRRPVLSGLRHTLIGGAWAGRGWV